ncbi:MAG: type II toxin-antitoxin system PemK/MazF family toxin [Sciscionella sp.]
MRYGEIYWANPDPGVGSEQAGRRPVLIVSSNDAIDAIATLVTTIPLTTRERDWAAHVSITGEQTGLVERSWALCEQVRTISTQRIAGRLGVVDAATLRNITNVFRYLLNL